MRRLLVFLPYVLWLGGCVEFVDRGDAPISPLSPEPSADPEPISRGGTEVGSPLQPYSFKFVFDARGLNSADTLSLCWTSASSNFAEVRNPDQTQPLVARGGTLVPIPNLTFESDSPDLSLQQLGLEVEPGCKGSDPFSMLLTVASGIKSLVHKDSFLLEFKGAETVRDVVTSVQQNDDRKEQVVTTIHLVHRPFVNSLQKWRLSREFYAPQQAGLIQIREAETDHSVVTVPEKKDLSGSAAAAAAASPDQFE